MDPFSIIGLAVVATAGLCVKMHESYQQRLHKAAVEEAQRVEKERREARQRYVNQVVRTATQAAAKSRMGAREMAAAHPPEVRRLKELLRSFREDEFKWDAIIAVGDIYRRGAFPRFLPNTRLALELYKIAAMCPDGDIAGTGQLKYIETRTEVLSRLDQAGKPLPAEYGSELIRIAQLRIQGTPTKAFQKPKNKIRSADRIEIGKQTRTAGAADVRRTPAHPGLAGVAVPAAVATVADIPEYMIDAQNVHDHGVVKITGHTLDELHKTYGDDADKMRTKREIAEAIVKCQHLGKGPLADATAVLNTMSSEHNKSLGTSEIDALALVWAKIQSQTPELRENLTETLVKQLASGVEYGHVVCSTGKITRVASVLETLGDGTKARPMWAVRDEIATLANRIRDEHLAKLNEENRTSYNEGKLPNVEEAMKKSFESEVRRIYCEDLGMNWTILAPIVEQLIEGF